MKTKYIAYTRVSTQKQGAEGVSLSQQQKAINEYAAKHRITIIDWYEECATAKKSGSKVFNLVMSRLRKANGPIGLILHKIDRGARNLRDWADIGEAIDAGIPVRFAHDDIDLHTRGGRLSADIQAVIAADYIRNLREEVLKGIHGRLEQGLFPFGAPRGYRNTGSGKVKVPDPIIAPLVIAAFERYATGAYSLTSLSKEMAILGLAGSDGNPIRSTVMAKMLHNPFYAGWMMVRGVRFKGIHQALVSEELFDSVQGQFRKRAPKRRRRHNFKYRRMLQCRGCTSFLIGERQKKFVYYRCHNCRGVCVREDRVLSTDVFKSKFWELIDPKNKALEPYQKFESPKGYAHLHKNCPNGSF